MKFNDPYSYLHTVPIHPSAGVNRDSHILKNIKYIQSGLKIFLLSILSLHGWTYFSPRIFVICHVVKEIQYKNLKNCPYSPQFIYGIINKLKTSFPSNVLLNIHSTLILPYLNYCMEY